MKRLKRAVRPERIAAIVSAVEKDGNLVRAIEVHPDGTVCIELGSRDMAVGKAKTALMKRRERKANLALNKDA